jgi:hypothetical protein
MFTENKKTIIRNFVRVLYYDQYGRMWRLEYPPGSTFILETGEEARDLQIVEDPNRNRRGERTVSVMNVAMFALGAGSTMFFYAL